MQPIYLCTKLIIFDFGISHGFFFELKSELKSCERRIKTLFDP